MARAEPAAGICDFHTNGTLGNRAGHQAVTATRYTGSVVTPAEPKSMRIETFVALFVPTVAFGLLGSIAAFGLIILFP